MPSNPAKKTFTLPLVETPKSHTHVRREGNCEVEITITACPGQWITYEAKWLRTPPAGIVALFEGQAFLKRNGQKTGRELRTFRALSTGHIFPPMERLEKYDLDGADDHGLNPSPIRVQVV